MNIYDARNRLYLLGGHKVFHREKVYGKYISFLPMTETVEGLTLRGFKYPLQRRTIGLGTGLCISNELKREEGILAESPLWRHMINQDKKWLMDLLKMIKLYVFRGQDCAMMSPITREDGIMANKSNQAYKIAMVGLLAALPMSYLHTDR